MDPIPDNNNDMVEDINEKEYFSNYSLYSIKKQREKALLFYKEFIDNNLNKNLIKSAFKLDNSTSLINSLYLKSLIGSNKFAKNYLLYNYSINEIDKEKIIEEKNIKSEKEKFIILLSNIEKCDSIDQIIIILCQERKIENPYLRKKKIS